ncbi:phosphoglucomutase/phosphomannomutase family protein [Pseudophaeobacter arcticus]|uniref:phosphoglucomutase/phosphomannomutase family protein n=1 Tax=Pseudophaeobacter arcticus TaxID=385492 RepID=UPI002492DE04|nr:phosphoglucomutase/phosphomannomutase family protein [Pseudophaeobacter arcticus]
MAIRFGTDGWRGLIADDFTFANVELVSRAAARFYRKEKNADRGIVIGYDSRFLSREFAELSARVFASEGMRVWLTNRISTTPQVSLTARKKRLAGGIVITASHNPAEYNGFKLKAGYGGPSGPADIAKVQANVTAFEEKPPKRTPKLRSFADYVDAGTIREFDARSEYVEYIKKNIDLRAIKRAGFTVLYDPMFGAGIELINLLLPKADSLHDEHNPGFIGIDHPEPLGEYLGDLSKRVRKEGYSIGLATDGDADRLGVIAGDGSFIDSHRVFVLLLKYLFEDRKKRGMVAKTISLSTMVDDYCAKNRIKLVETPVGFKYIADLMATKNVLIGGEESGGLGTSLHIPERDGIFNGLLVMEMMAKRKKTIGELSKELDEEFGPHRYRRIDKRMTELEKNRILKAAKKGLDSLGPYKVTGTSHLDGYKFFVDGGWLLIRASGTEPLLRFYAEASSIAKVNRILEAGMGIGGA